MNDSDDAEDLTEAGTEAGTGSEGLPASFTESESPWESEASTSEPAPNAPVSAPPTARLLIDGEFTIQRAEAIRAELFPLLEREPSLEIDLSGVAEIDSAGVQLLLVAKRTAQARNKELRLLGHSPAVLDVFQLLSLSAYFGDSQFIPAATEEPA